MRRSICQCEPKIAYAGNVGTWKFIFTTAGNLPKDTKLKFKLDSEGKPGDWQLPEANPKNKTNMIWLELPNGKTVKAEKLNDNPLSSSYEFVLPSEIKATESLVFLIGTPLENAKEKGNRCQTHTQRRRTFNLFIDTKGKGDYKEKENFLIDVRGNILSKMRILGPSVVARNKRFDVVIRFEDEFGNLTCNAEEDTLVEVSYDHLRESLNWKLFVPETGFITLPNLYFNEAGTYQFKLKNLKTGQNYSSSPIKCFDDKDISLHWGLLHGEAEKVDSDENIEKALRHFRDERALQFYATSPFESESNTQNQWKTTSNTVAEFNEDDRFSTFLGFQWKGKNKDEGVRQILFSKDAKPLLQSTDNKYSNLSKIYKLFSPKEILSIPTFTMDKENSFSFDAFNPDYERVVEIFNAWGSSETTAKDKNLFPIASEKKKSSIEAADGSIQKALLANCRFGFVAGGLDDRGIYENCYEQNVQYTPGLTGIYSKEHSRASLFEALQNRSCFATTGAKMILGFDIANNPMGTELTTKNKPGLELNRHISGFVIGTDKLKEVSIIRNGKVLKTFKPTEDQLDFSYDDLEPLKTTVLKDKATKIPFVFYYLRAVQEDGHVAWSSPIWVDQQVPDKKKK